MTENSIFDEVLSPLDDLAVDTEFVTSEPEIKKPVTELKINKKSAVAKNEFNDKVCKVYKYDKKNRTLDINFDGYGIRINDVADFTGDTVTLKHKGQIGKSDFVYKL